MEILSLLSFSVFIFYSILGFYTLKQHRNKQFQLIAFLADVSLAIWAFCYTFVYIAPTAEEALLWHRAAAVGFCLFPVFVCHLLLLLTGNTGLLEPKWRLLLFYTLPMIILFHSLLADSTCFAQKFVPSLTNLGWAYFNQPTNPWIWIYVLYVGLYLGGALFAVNQWKGKSTYAYEKIQGRYLITVIAVIVMLGLSIDIILPFFAPVLPPLSNILIAIFAISFFFLADRYQIFKFSKIASSDIILNTIMDPVLLLDDGYKIQKMNHAVTMILGYHEKALLGKPIQIMFRGNQQIDELLKLTTLDKTVNNCEIDIKSISGTMINTTLSAALIEDREHGFNGFILTFHDITMRKKVADALLKSKEKYRSKADELFIMANYDLLTQLPNRRFFFTRLEELKAQYLQNHEDFAVIFMDLNGFKAVNDNFGHDVGDLVLIEAAKRLEIAKNPEEFLARIGGDEFTLIIPAVKSQGAVEGRIQAIKMAFEKPVGLTELGRELSIAAGYGLFSRAEENIDTLIYNADLKMYADKRRALQS